MHQHQQYERKMIHKRAVPDVLPTTTTGTESTPAAPTTTSKTTTTHTTTSTSSTHTTTSTSAEVKATSTTSTTSTTSSSPSTTSTSTSTSSTSTTSSSSTTLSTTSTTSALNVPTTMSGGTTAPPFSNGLLSSATLTSAASDPTHTADIPDTNPTGNVATNHIGSGTIVAIIAGSIAGIAALLILSCFIRRKLRTKRRRGTDDWTNRASFMRNSIALPNDMMDPGRPVVGTRNALALARANMGHTGASETEMTQATQHPVTSDGYAANNWGTYGNNGQADHAPYQEHYDQQQYAQPGYNAHDPRAHDYQQHQQYNQYPAGDYGYQEHPEQHHEKYADLTRQLEVPAVALTAPPTHHSAHDQYYNNAGAGRTSPPVSPLGRTLSTSAYGSLSAHQPTPSHPTRSGTPVDSNPQQAYLAPGLRAHNADGSLHSRSSVYEEDDAYGGI